MTSPGGYPGEDFDSLAELTYSRNLRVGLFTPPRGPVADLEDLKRAGPRFRRLQSILARSQLSPKC